MQILICLDDTDNRESIGTGELLENMCEALEKNGLAKGGFITRHQLFIHEDIPFTSHNSSMCMDFEANDIKKVSDFAKDYLSKNAAEGSDPGICILKIKEGTDYTKLFEYSKRAKEEIIEKSESYALAEKYPDVIDLSEHGGLGIGVIGALAGVGLRMSGNDGRIKGKLKPIEGKEYTTVGEILSDYPVERIINEDKEDLPLDTVVRFVHNTKMQWIDYKKTLILLKKDGGYEPKPKKKRA